ncbi:MAG: hypothetical protein VB124_01945 [Burkholderia sp.]
MYIGLASSSRSIYATTPVGAQRVIRPAAHSTFTPSSSNLAGG